MGLDERRGVGEATRQTGASSPAHIDVAQRIDRRRARGVGCIVDVAGGKQADVAIATGDDSRPTRIVDIARGVDGDAIAKNAASIGERGTVQSSRAIANLRTGCRKPGIDRAGIGDGPTGVERDRLRLQKAGRLIGDAIGTERGQGFAATRLDRTGIIEAAVGYCQAVIAARADHIAGSIGPVAVAECDVEIALGDKRPEVRVGEIQRDGTTGGDGASRAVERRRGYREVIASLNRTGIGEAQSIRCGYAGIVVGPDHPARKVLDRPAACNGQIEVTGGGCGRVIKRGDLPAVGQAASGNANSALAGHNAGGVVERAIDRNIGPARAVNRAATVNEIAVIRECQQSAGGDAIGGIIVAIAIDGEGKVLVR